MSDRRDSDPQPRTWKDRDLPIDLLSHRAVDETRTRKPSAWQADALPIELLPHSGPGEIRTHTVIILNDIPLPVGLPGLLSIVYITGELYRKTPTGTYDPVSDPLFIRNAFTSPIQDWYDSCYSRAFHKTFMYSREDSNPHPMIRSHPF